MPKIALIQLSVDARPSVNKEKTESAIREAAANGAQIVCTQELFTTEYFCRTEECDLFDLAEPVPGELTEAHRKLAAELGVVIVASGFEKRATGLYHNTAWVVDADGSFLGMYRKMHIPQDPGFEEKFYFTPGDLGYKAFDTKFGRIGVLICWVQWYPEAARLTAMQGAEIIFYPTAIGWLPEEKPLLGEQQHCAWETVQRGHAVANGCYVCAVNRVGTEGESEFWGQSFVADYYGQIVAMKPSCTRTLTWTHWKTTAASGPFSVTAALTPTAALRNAGAGEPSPFARFMYSEEPLERQWAQVREVLLDMEEQCDDLVIDCLQGMVGELGCQVTVRRREHILTLLRELNHLYDCGIPAREMICEEDEEYCFSWIYEFDFYLGDADYLLHFVVDAALNSNGIVNKYLTLERQVYRKGLCLKASEPMVLDPDALERLKEKIVSAMACPPNTGRFLDWDDD